VNPADFGQLIRFGCNGSATRHDHHDLDALLDAIGASRD
jgi:hypothetical protein